MRPSWSPWSPSRPERYRRLIPAERVTGSLAFGALARVVLATAKLPEEHGGGCILVRAKSNLGPDAGGFGYHLDLTALAEYPGISATRVIWGEVLEGSARDLLSRADARANPDEQSALEDAKGFLLAMLADGPVAAKQIKQEASEAGHAERTLKRAKSALGIIASKGGLLEHWAWSLAEGGQRSNQEPPWPPSGCTENPLRNQ